MEQIETKRRPGRPRRAEQPGTVRFNLTQREIDDLEELAWDRRLTLGDLLRELVRRELSEDRKP